MSYEIEFANRTYELDEICRPGGKRVVLVDAPAGYGKSYLLREVKGTYEKRGNWLVVLVDLKSKSDMSSDRVHVASAAIANEIAKQAGEKAIATSHMTEDAIIAAINDLLQPRAEQILLLFDGIEVLSNSVSGWLRDMISRLDGTLQIAGSELRLVLAGRYAKDWSRKAWFNLRRLELSPFDLEIIRSIVDSALKRGQLADRNDPAFIYALATHTQWISGGHPKAICGIVSEIEKLTAVPVPLEYFFVHRVCEASGHSGTMFDLYVEPIIQEIVEPLPEAVREALETIGVFRKFNPDILDILINTGEVAGFDRGWNLLEELMKTHLVNTPNLANPMYSDEIVRRMLAIRMQIQEPSRYKRLNEQAKEIFRTWARGQQIEGLPKDGELDTQFRLVSIVESLYHALCLMPHTVDPTEPERVIVERDNENAIAVEIQQYRENIRKPDTVRRLMSALTEDQEIQELICSRAGERGYSRLISTVEEFVEEKREDESSKQMPE
jgi:hypothetical protein